MNRHSPQSAVRAGIPFIINVDDGKPYEVREPWKNRCRGIVKVVLDERDLPHMQAILTMTGISYLPKENGAK